jgi:hypothetical protein
MYQVIECFALHFMMHHMAGLLKEDELAFAPAGSNILGLLSVQDCAALGSAS